MLGPLEDVLRQEIETLPADAAAGLDIAHRNSLRLLKLVNTLLDFSRIEAGRIDASFEPVDLAGVTAELASVFRSAIEKAGLRLVVDCPALPEPVYIDRDMWEKIVLNLLSNALKFTFEGEIRVALRWRGTHAELQVADTGVGIPAADLPRMFQRFHRVKHAQARTHEGTGIGLALVHELARLHGGDVRGGEPRRPGRLVHRHHSRRLGAPAGGSHRRGAAADADEHRRPAVRRGGAALAAARPGARIRGARRPDLPASTHPVPAGARVLVADDNADMRDYLTRILGERYEVEAVRRRPGGARPASAPGRRIWCCRTS